MLSMARLFSLFFASNSSTHLLAPKPDCGSAFSSVCGSSFLQSSSMFPALAAWRVQAVGYANEQRLNERRVTDRRCGVGDKDSHTTNTTKAPLQKGGGTNAQTEECSLYVQGRNVQPLFINQDTRHSIHMNQNHCPVTPQIEPVPFTAYQA